MGLDSDAHFSGAKATYIAIALCFLLVIGVVSIIQFVNEVRSREPLQEFDILKRPPSVANLRAYENAMEDNSVVAKAIRPWYQWLSTRLTNKGNGKVVIGREGWLFYRPALDYIVKPGSNFDRESGHLPAIAAFHETLKAQGVDLILLPIPGKATIYPEFLSSRYDTKSGPPVNPRAHELFSALRESGIQVLDPTEMLWKQKLNPDDGLLYMKQDTHWSPRGMKLVAEFIAETVQAGGWSADAPQKPYYATDRDVERFGDLYDMLNLPKAHSGFEPLSITVETVVDSQTEEPCIPDSNSPIVLLGDSFVNVFSRAEMGLGENGGLGEHLALLLNIPIDVIAINDGGPTTSRESLARRPNALVGKKLVIWQFATRDLVNPESEWKIVDIPKPQIDVEAKKDQLVVVAEVSKVSNVPDPSRVAYSECLTYIKYRVLKVEQGEYSDEELIAVFWGMRDSKLMPAARFQIGEKHRLTLDPFEKHEELSHVMQADDTDDYEHQPFWALQMSPL